MLFNYEPLVKLDAAIQAEMLIYFASSPIVQSHVSQSLAWVITGVESNDYNGVAWIHLYFP